MGGCSFYALNIPYPTAGRKGELLFIPRNLHNQIRQIGSRRGPAKTCYLWIYTRLAAGDNPTKPNISAYTAGTQVGQIRARTAGDRITGSRPRRSVPTYGHDGAGSGPVIW